MSNVFYFTDIHGMGQLYDTIIDFCIKQDPQCTIIFGGDACDRGPDGYRIMKDLLSRTNVIYLLGNHELLFINAARAVKRYYEGIEPISPAYHDDVFLHSYNGGKPTLDAWQNDGMPTDILAKLEELPLICSYKNFDFCHAGGHPKRFQMLEQHEEYATEDDINHCTWDRNCLGFGWIPNRICVFGHTPVIHLAAKYYQQDKSLAAAHPCKYTGFLDDKWTGAKIDMDTCACGNGRAYVLNCDTLQAYGFRDTDFDNQEIHKHNIEQFEVIQL